MSSILKEEMYRALSGRAFWVALIAGFVFCLIGLRGYFEGPNPRDLPDAPAFLRNAYDAWFYGIGKGSSGIFTLLVPLVAVLPFADSYAVDRSSGFLRSLLMRTSHTAYLRAKLIANATVGALAVGLPMLLTFGVTMAILPLGLPPQEMAPFRAAGLLKELYRDAPALYILFLSGIGFLFGAAYATFAMALSTRLHNRYLILATPFLLYHIANFGFAVLTLAPWSPPATIAPWKVTTSTAMSVFGELGLILVASALVVWMFSKRREVEA